MSVNCITETKRVYTNPEQIDKNTDNKKNSSRVTSSLISKTQANAEDKARIRNRSTEVNRNELSTDENCKIKEHLYKALSTVNQQLNVKTELKDSYVAPTKGLGSFINKQGGQQYSNRTSKPKLPQVQKISKKQSKIMELTNLMDNIASLNNRSNPEIQAETEKKEASLGQLKEKPEVFSKAKKPKIIGSAITEVKSMVKDKGLVPSETKWKETPKSNTDLDDDANIEADNVQMGENKEYPNVNKAYIKQKNSKREEEEYKDYAYEEEGSEGNQFNILGTTVKIINDQCCNNEGEEISKENDSNLYSEWEENISPNQLYSKSKSSRIEVKDIILPVSCSTRTLPKTQSDLLKTLAKDGLIKYGDDSTCLTEINISGLLNMLLIKDFENNKLKKDLEKEQEKLQKQTNEYNDTLDYHLHHQSESLIVSKLKAEIMELTTSNSKLTNCNNKLEKDLNALNMQLKAIGKRYRDDIAQYESLTKSLFNDIDNSS